MYPSAALQHFLSEMEYPATKDDLLREARREMLGPDEQWALQQLDPGGYSARREVICALDMIAPPRPLVAA